MKSLFQERLCVNPLFARLKHHLPFPHLSLKYFLTVIHHLMIAMQKDLENAHK